MNDNWIDSLKVGDRVVLVKGRTGARYVRKVERILKASLTLNLSKAKFRKDTGREITTDWFRDHIEQLTPENEPEIREECRRREDMARFMEIKKRIEDIPFSKSALHALKDAVEKIDPEVKP